VAAGGLLVVARGLHFSGRPAVRYASPQDPQHLQLGQIEARGETGVLTLPLWLLTRQRSNTFHSYLLERIDEFVADGAAQP
jgi:hypothetical protein